MLRHGEVAEWSKTAISSTNYQLACKGVVIDGDRAVYALQLTSRKRRAGPIKGGFRLDRETGLPLRQSGYLVNTRSRHRPVLFRECAGIA
jgi:hypothetical protein